MLQLITTSYLLFSLYATGLIAIITILVTYRSQLAYRMETFDVSKVSVVTFLLVFVLIACCLIAPLFNIYWLKLLYNYLRNENIF